jgi:hypothetical protein
MDVDKEKTFVTGKSTDPVLEAKERGWNKKKVKGLYKTEYFAPEKKEARSVATGANTDEGLSIEETNKMRKGLGLALLK